MKVKDEKGRVLFSENPVIVGMWENAGYVEVVEDKSESQGDNEPPKDSEPLEDGEGAPKDGDLLTDDDPLGNDP